ncbi:MAG: hypothetical protein AAGM22_13815 [Acidobacteriota bacterium]
MTTSTSITFALCLSAILASPAVASGAQGADQPVVGDASAQTAERPSLWERFSTRHDTNQDGVITRDEFQKDDERFQRLDQNLDGQLTEADFEGLKSRRFGELQNRGLIRGADINRDGRVTAEEWASFEQALDVDGDGVVSDGEMQALRDVRRSERSQRFGGRDAKRGQKSFDGQAQSPFDADQSGGLDAAERAALFSSFDTNGDGTVSADEMPQGRRGGKDRGQRGARFGMGLLKAADGDQDRRVSLSEWQSFLQAADADGDGTLSRTELEAVRPEGAPAAPATRPEGAPSLETERLEALFTMLDANEDGVIADDEWPRRRGPRGRGR